MYYAYLDGKVLHDPYDDVRCLIDPVVTPSTSEVATFEFNVHPGHPLYEAIQTRISMVDVYQVDETGKEKLIFRGEVRESEKDFEKIKEVYCVGELTYLYDSIQPRIAYAGDIFESAAGPDIKTWFYILIEEHNRQVEEKKRFTPGMVMVPDNYNAIRYTNREDTMSVLKDLCERYGGYLRIRYVGSTRYIDFVTLDDYGKKCEQAIEFGENLLDYVERTSGNEIYTACIPLGDTIETREGEGDLLTAITGQPRWDIASENGGCDYVYIPEAVNKFGWIKKVVEFEYYASPEALKEKGLEWLRDNQYEKMTLSLTAVDLSLLDGNNFDTFEVGDYVRVTAAPYGMDRWFPVTSMKIYLTEPDKNTINLGVNDEKTASSVIAGTSNSLTAEGEKNYVRTKWLQVAIDNATAMITGSKGGYKLTEYDEKGLWLRDLYMDAPSKENAKNIMQINMNGIGFSRNGFNGPYENAWTIDGQLLGEYIKAHSIKAEQLSTEYTTSVQTAIKGAESGAKTYANDLVTTAISTTNDNISLSVSTERRRAEGVEETLRSAITIAQDAIKLRVTEGDVNSLIDQKADSIRLKAGKISWKSDYSSMTERGVLTCERIKLSVYSSTARKDSGGFDDYTFGIKAPEGYPDIMEVREDGCEAGVRLHGPGGILLASKKIFVKQSNSTADIFSARTVHEARSNHITVKNGSGDNITLTFRNGILCMS